VIERLRARKEWKFLGILPKADRPLSIAWWFALLLRGLLPALFAIAMGVLVGAVQRGDSLTIPLGLVGAVFVLLQVLSPLHRTIGINLGSRAAAWLYDELTTACVGPPGMGHLEDSRLTTDLTMARDFDLGITGPPLSISMDFIAAGLVEMVGGLASAVVLAAYAWWAPILLAGAWLATHWLLRESAIWRDRNTDEVRAAQRHADYACCLPSLMDGSQLSKPQLGNRVSQDLSRERTFLRGRGKIVPHPYVACHRHTSGILRSSRAHRSGWHGRIGRVAALPDSGRAIDTAKSGGQEVRSG
jgi:hypothetical protein